MTNDREFSDLKLERKECPKCGAIWINGEHRWSGTGNKGNDGGDTWAKRLEDLEKRSEESDVNL